MADGYYVWKYENADKLIDVWTGDDEEFEIRIIDKTNWGSQAVSIPGFDLAKSILTSVWGRNDG